MSQITTGLRSILSHPGVYSVFQDLMGARSGWHRLVDNYIRPKAGDTVLDVGCGPGDLLAYLPDVRYWGFDISEPYIARAQSRHGNHGRFFCKLLTLADLNDLPAFDIVVGSGLLHHMDDGTASEFLRLSFEALKPSGRLVTVDPCFARGQNPFAKFLISRDRGQHVRDEQAYARLALTAFTQVNISVRHKCWVPYTHCYMECTKT